MSHEQHESRRIRKVNPLGMRILVQIRKDSDVTDGGLYLPAGAKHSLQDSVLVEVNPARMIFVKNE